MIGYWLTSQSIVWLVSVKINYAQPLNTFLLKKEYNQKSILDNNNKEKSLRERSLVGINLIDGFEYIDGAKKLSGGRIYDPGRGRTLNQIFIFTKW